MSEKRFQFIKGITITFFAVVIYSFGGFSQINGSKVIDKIVARVGDEIILLSDVQNQRLQLLQDGQEGDASTDCDILEEFMYQKLLINQAAIDSIQVPDDVVNAEMENRIRFIAEQIGSIEALEDFYGKSVAKIKAEFFELIKKRMLAERMKETITENIKITPKEVKTFYKSLPKDSIPYINSKVTVAHLVLYPEITEADKKRAYDKLKGLRSDISGGIKRFETSATLNSDDPGSKLNGGDLGWQTRGTMVPEFEAALFKLEKNEISPVFETQFGYHIIQMIDRKGDNYNCRHILVSPKIDEQALIKAATTIDSIHKEVTKGTITFEEAARRFSDDDNSKFNNGKIVNPYTNDYNWDIQNINDIDPQMSRIVERMNIGQFSTPTLYNNPFEQKQGIRIVKLLGKSDPHLADLETDRQLIELAAINEKKQKVIDEWIEKKIRENYIEIAPEFISTCDFQYNWIREVN